VSIDPNQIRLEGAAASGRYVYRFADGSEAEMAYAARQPGVVTITHTGTPPRHRGQGVAAALVAKAVADFRAAGLKVVPACWFVREQFDAHPDWADLLHRS
jgi:predicted GNAT family acetyltransferase